MASKQLSMRDTPRSLVATAQRTHHPSRIFHQNHPYRASVALACVEHALDDAALGLGARFSIMPKTSENVAFLRP